MQGAQMHGRSSRKQDRFPHSFPRFAGGFLAQQNASAQNGQDRKNTGWTGWLLHENATFRYIQHSTASGAAVL